MKILNACLVAAFCLCASSAMAVDNTDSTVAAGAGAGVKAATETMGAKAGEATDSCPASTCLRRLRSSKTPTGAAR